MNFLNIHWRTNMGKSNGCPMPHEFKNRHSIQNMFYVNNNRLIGGNRNECDVKNLRAETNEENSIKFKFQLKPIEMFVTVLKFTCEHRTLTTLRIMNEIR